MAPSADPGPPGRAFSRRRGGLLLVLAVILSAVLPGPHLPLRTERTVYAGPDLFSPVPPVTRLTGRHAVVPGLLERVERRVTQEGRLLREDRVLRVRLPVPLLVLLVFWAGARLAASPRQPRSSPTPETSRSTSSSEV